MGALWRLPDPYWAVSLLSPFFLATIHASLWRAELADGRATPQRFNAWEIALLVAFGLFNAFALWAATLAYFVRFDRRIASTVVKVVPEV